jgi:hypothetical protein
LFLNPGEHEDVAEREKDDVVGRLIQAVLIVANALMLYGIWLLWPEKFPIMLLGILGILAFGWLMDAAKLRKEGYQEKRHLAAGEKRRCFCTSLN